MTVQEMRELKKALGLSNKEVAARSGVSLGTVQKVFSGESKVPRHQTLIHLEKAFPPKIPQENGAKPSFVEEWTALSEQYLREYAERDGNPAVSDSAPAYQVDRSDLVIHGNIQKGIGPYTQGDYQELPEDVRAELIDGHFYDMSSPSFIHQQLVLEIAVRLRAYVKRNKGNCITSVAPTDVSLNGDDRTVLVPDIFVVCDRKKITGPRVVGAPDLVIEVLSPAGWQRDMVLKLRKYREAGVREYWVILPEQKMVYAYVFDRKPDPELYTFDDRIPVAIWDGKCEVDFAEIYEDIRFLYEQ